MQTRTGSAIRNVYFSLFSQFINILVKFGMRTVFVYCLGKEYLGINGVFSNVLTILSLTELGLGSAIVYSMYKPIAEGNERKVTQFVKYYKKIYMMIGIIIITLGCCLIPFLGYLITDMPDVEHIRFIYVLFLLNSATSYFFAQYVSLINAYQMSYEYKKIQMWFSILKAILQSVFLVVTHMYIVYLLIDIALNFSSNYAVYRKARCLFPFITEYKGELEKEEKTELWKNALSNFSIKIGITVINSTDNLVISACISTILVGLYSNYLMVIQIILTTAVLVQQALMAGIGNACVTGTDQSKQQIYHRLLFLYGGLFCIIVGCLYSLMQPFIALWLGTEYMLTDEVTLVMIVNCYLSGMHQVNEAFIYSDGLYQHFKWKPWMEALLNLVISIVLARQIGIIGVLIGTTISHFMLTFWYDAYIVYKYSIHLKIGDYFKRYLSYAACAALVIVVECFMNMMFKNASDTIGIFFLKAVCGGGLSTGTWLLFFGKTDECRYYYKLGKRILRSLRVG